MKTITILLLLCSAASAKGSLTCCPESVASTALKTVMDQINEHHHHLHIHFHFHHWPFHLKFNFHGYKFKSTDFVIYEVDQTAELCTMKIRVNLTETKCHAVNPKPYEECELRCPDEPRVIALCNVEIQVKNDEVTVVAYNCLTKRVEVVGCPDCPVLTHLTDPTGVLSVSTAVEHINANSNNERYFALKEIGRITTGYMFAAGIGFFAEFAIVETHCPREPNMNPEACMPLCHDRARHGFCKSTYTTVEGLKSVDCEYYPPLVMDVVVPEPCCVPTWPTEPPTNGGNPYCPGLIDYDHALHPICPWPEIISGHPII